MNDRRIRRWALLGALASAALLAPACQSQESRGMPREGTANEGIANDSQDLDSFGEAPATGGSGSQPQPGENRVPEHASGAEGNQSGIGAPGFSSPRENPNTTDPRYDEPVRGETLDERPRRQDEGQVPGSGEGH